MRKTTLLLSLMLCMTACRTAPVTPMTTRAPLTAPTRIAAQGNREWNYVVLGDSTQFDVFTRYAAILEQDLGVKVQVQNWTVNGQHSGDLLAALRTNQSLQQDIRKAQMVTFIIPMRVLKEPITTLLSSDPAQCGGTDHQDCLRQALKSYEADTEAIFAELVSLRSPSETLFRTMDLYQIEARQIKEHAASEIVGKYWREANGHVIQVATKYQIPAARVYTAFMGANGDEDPVGKGYMADSTHPSYKGADVIADLLRRLGYAYASEP